MPGWGLQPLLEVQEEQLSLLEVEEEQLQLLEVEVELLQLLGEALLREEVAAPQPLPLQVLLLVH